MFHRLFSANMAARAEMPRSILALLLGRDDLPLLRDDLPLLRDRSASEDDDDFAMILEQSVQDGVIVLKK